MGLLAPAHSRQQSTGTDILVVFEAIGTTSQDSYSHQVSHLFGQHFTTSCEGKVCEPTEANGKASCDIGLSWASHGGRL